MNWNRISSLFDALDRAYADHTQERQRTEDAEARGVADRDGKHAKQRGRQKRTDANKGIHNGNADAGLFRCDCFARNGIEKSHCNSRKTLKPDGDIQKNTGRQERDQKARERHPDQRAKVDPFARLQKIEQKGNSYVICDTERPKLNAAYMDLLDKLHQLPTSPGAAQAQLSYKRDGQTTQQTQNTTPTVVPQTQQQAQQSQQPLPFMTRQVCQYIVVSVSSQQDMSGQPLVCATLQNAEGKQAKVYAQGSHPALTPGAQLYDAQITMRKQGNVAFYTLDGYQVVQQAA